jgi:antitoxin component HigA of HigAB toxin-antitoxin module
MSKSGTASLAIAAAVLALSAHADDTRQLVTMPSPMVQHMLANMRDHLAAITEIQRALGAADYQRAADIAEKRIGMSSLEAHGAAHMAGFMPQPMQDIGTQMHKAASRFALVAQETGADGNLARAVSALSTVTEQCAACHAAYRAH